MRGAASLMALAGALTWSTAALAQETDGKIDRPGASSGANEASGGIPVTALAVRGSSDDSNVSLTLTNKVHTLGDDGVLFASLTLGAPLSAKDKRGSFLTDDGLPDQFTAKLNLSFVLIDLSPVKSDTLDDLAEIDDAYHNSCKAAVLVAKPTASAADVGKACEFVKSIQNRSPENLQKYLSPADYKRLFAVSDSGVANRDLVVINIGGTLGYNEYSYLKDADFSEQSAKRKPWGLSASIGWQAANSAPFIGAGYEFKQSYKESDKRIACVGTVPTGCRYETFDAPVSRRSQTAFGLIRFSNLFGAPRKFDDKRKLGPVLEFKGGYDFEAKQWGFGVPLYFIIDKDEKTKGGVRFDWQGKDKAGNKPEGRFSVFVAQSFDFLGF